MEVWERLSAKANQLNLSFDDISYSVRAGIFCRESKILLSKISGDFRPGELTAIMGRSGAGKSTLMDILTGFTSSNVKGEVLVNGEKRNLASFRRSSAYIMQDHHLQPLLTVAESMRIAADLKLESNTSSYDKQHGIDVILREMSLDVARDTRTKNLSGGQKKRLAIALELISNPPIMFFDEPTSGLDSVTARQCLGLLKSLAEEGRTIVCTIHQPSASLFDMIDHLYVLDKGHCVYAGSAKNVVQFLKSFDLSCPIHYDPADFLMEIVNGDYGEEHLQRLILSSDRGRCKRWRDDDHSAAGPSASTNQSSKIRCVDFQPKIPLSAKSIVYELHQDANSVFYPNVFFRQLWILLKQNVIKLSRDRVLFFIRLSVHFLIGLLVGAMYYQIGQDATYVMDNVSLLFFTLVFLVFNAFNITYITFVDEIPILAREHFNRWYKLHSYYIAHKLADLPVQTFACACYAIIVYKMSGQITDIERMGLFLFMCIIMSLVAQIMGLAVGIAMSIQNAVMFGPMVVVPSMVFSGYFVYIRDAPSYIQWLFHASFFKYGYEGVVVAIYGYDRAMIDCSSDYCHFRFPEVLLKLVDMRYSSYWTSTIFMLVLYLALDVLAFWLLRMRLERRKPIL